MSTLSKPDLEFGNSVKKEWIKALKNTPRGLCGNKDTLVIGSFTRYKISAEVMV